jgi:hypothetical protein
MSTEDLAYALVAVLDDVDPDSELAEIQSVVTFRDAGVMSSNDGLVVSLVDGSEFQLQIVRSR